MKMPTTTAAERIGGPVAQTAVDVQLLDVRGVATLLGCSVRHVYRLADSGRMPRPMKLGQLVRWRRSELQVWIDAGCQRQQIGGQRR